MSFFGAYNVKHLAVAVADPTASVTIPIFQVEARTVQIEILRAWVVSDTALGAGTANGRQVNLVNMGTAATATTVITSVAGSSTGGTYAAWVSDTPIQLSVTAGTLLKNQYLGLQYAEAGADAFKNLVVHVEYVTGKGS